MKLANAVSLAAALAFVAAPCNQALALPPPPTAPFTLWNFLGIPQGFHKIRDATMNTRGNHPGLERKPPLKALADPANLMSPNPAIAKAAEIKTQEDMAPQKVKAIKYLASVGCGCYPGVKDALMAALDDCTEEVRYQAVEAIGDAASQHCEVCNKNCCCDEDLVMKLSQIAYEKNDKGCWLEASERVRDAAKEAMCACCPGRGPVTEPTKQPEERGEGDIPEGAPTPPPPVAPGAETSAQHLHGSGQALVSATRIHETRTKLILPQGGTVVSDEGPSLEVVTVDFGNHSPAATRTASTSTSRRPANQTSTDQRPAAQGSAATAPAIAGRTPQPHRSATASDDSLRDIAPRATEALRRQAQQPASSSVPLGQSSRRAAVERGLAAPQSVTNKTPVTSAAKATTANRAAQSKQPVGDLKNWLFPSNNKVSDTKSDKGRASVVAYVTDDSAKTSKPAAKQASPQPVADRANSKQESTVHGTVSRVSLDSGTVEVRLPRGSRLSVGDRLKVSHEYMLNEATLGALEVVAIGPNSVTTRPVGDLKLDKIARGDEAVYESGRARSRASQSASPAGKFPSLSAKMALNR